MIFVIIFLILIFTSLFISSIVIMFKNYKKKKMLEKEDPINKNDNFKSKYLNDRFNNFINEFKNMKFKTKEERLIIENKVEDLKEKIKTYKSEKDKDEDRYKYLNDEIETFNDVLNDMNKKI